MSTLIECHLERCIIVYWMFKVNLRKHALEKLTMSFYLSILPARLWTDCMAPNPKPLEEFFEHFAAHFSSRIHRHFGRRSRPANPVLTDDVDQVL